MKLEHNGIWGWGIHGLNWWGIYTCTYDLNGFAQMGGAFMAQMGGAVMAV